MRIKNVNATCEQMRVVGYICVAACAHVQEHGKGFKSADKAFYAAVYAKAAHDSVAIFT